jgi:uncharacterized protein YabN with tetrapyrrole methylase and pyrophosphatase domain
MKELALIGIGIRDFKQATIEVLELIPHLDIVHHTTLFHNQLVQLNSNTISHVDRYLNASNFSVYDDIEREIENGFSTFDRIGFVTYGHPLLLVNISQSLTRYCNDNNISLKVYPGISSLDAIWCILGKDPGYPGFQLMDAEYLVKNNININTSLDLYLLHVTEAFIPFNRRAKIVDYPQGIQFIKDYLLKYFDKTKRVKFVAYSPLSNVSDFVLEVELGHLCDENILNKLFKGLTLVITKDE